MLIKVLFAAAAASIALAALVVSVCKTSNRLEDENEVLPEEEQRTVEELEEDLLAESIADIKVYRPVQFITRVAGDILDMVRKVYNYRIEASLLVIALTVFPTVVIPPLLLKAAYAVLLQELLYQAMLHIYNIWFKKEEDINEEVIDLGTINL